jgi:hypothetical protein
MKTFKQRTTWVRPLSPRYDLTDAQLRNYVSVAFSDHHAWLKYFPMYHDLFTTIEEARQKAKTHSVMVTCNYLLLTRGCPVQTLYENFVLEATSKKMSFHPELLRTQTQLAFILSLCEIR